MNGLLAKSVREIWVMTLLFALAMGCVMGLLTYILPQILQGGDQLLDSFPFVRPLISALLGVDVDQGLTTQVMQAILWVHPVVLTLLWAFEIIVCTRFPAGEIDRGTIDVLLSWPVSRRGVFMAETITWLAGGFLILLVGLLGHLITSPVIPAENRPGIVNGVTVLGNLYGVYLAVGGFAFLCSAVSNRRGRAIAVVFGFVLGSFLLNFLAQFWDPAKSIQWLSISHYYQPAQVLSGGLAAKDMIPLVGFGLVMWIAAGEFAARRDIKTV